MTVGELVEALKAFPPDAIVVVDGYESGFDDPIIQARVAILGSVRHDWDGQHHQCSWDEEHNPSHRAVVVVGREEIDEDMYPFSRDYAGLVAALKAAPVGHEDGQDGMDGDIVLRFTEPE